MISASQVANSITKKLGSFFSTDAHTPIDILRYINSGVRKICLAKSFKFNRYEYNFSTENNLTTYSIPYQIETYYILNEAGEEVEMLDFVDYHKDPDKAEKIGIWEDVLITDLKGNFKIYYRGFPENITSLEASINMPEHFMDVLIVIGTYFGFMDVKAYDKAGQMTNTFDGFIKDLATMNSNPKPMQIKRLNKSKNSTW